MTPYFAPQIDLHLTRFNGITDTSHGIAVTLPFEAWVQQRTAAASTYWPDAASLADALDSYRRDVATSGDDPDLLEENEKLWAAAIKAAKSNLSVEVGARLTDGRRLDAAVTSITWLFIDIDGIARDKISALISKLRDRGLCFYATESATSRLPLVSVEATGPYKVHIYVPIAPIYLPATVPTQDIKLWWQAVYKAAVAGLLSGVVDDHDTSVDDMAQPCFVAQVPPCGDRRSHAAIINGNYLDVEAYVASLGHNIPRPQPVIAAGTTAAHTAPMATRSVTASSGPTPNETTGSLVLAAIRGLGLLGRLLDAKHKMWAARCPWHADHQTDPLQIVLDSSTVIFEDGSVDGGFACKHAGCRAANGGFARTAADVLSLARRRGVNLPDRAGYGSIGASAVEAAQEAAAVHSDPAPKPHDPRLRIVVQDDRLADMAFATIASLSRRGDVYVKPTHFDNPHVGVIATIIGKDWRVATRSHLTTIISQTARFVRVSVDKDGGFKDKPVEIPTPVVNSVLDFGNYPSLRPLRAVIVNPALLPSGRIVDQAGYDAESGLFYCPDAQINIPITPNKTNAEAAKARLLSYVKHTVWNDDRGPAIWLSFVLTIAGRAAIPTVPSFGFDAAAQKSGKTALVKIAYGLMHGHTIVTQPPPPEREEEVEKRLPQWAAMSVVCFDNLTSMFASARIDQAITAAQTGTRRLGVNENLVCDFTSTTFSYTGNNITLGDDAASRTLIARIKPPTTRKFDFAVDDADYYRAHRPGAVADALTILRAFISVGSPQSAGPDCRFVEWSRLIRGAVKWLGMPDPVGGDVVDASDEARSEALHALAEWLRSCGDALSPFIAGDIDCDRYRGRDETEDAYRLRRRVIDAMTAVAGQQIDSAIKLGRAFHKLRDATISTASGSYRFLIEDVKPRKRYRFVADR